MRLGLLCRQRALTFVVRRRQRYSWSTLSCSLLSWDVYWPPQRYHRPHRPLFLLSEVALWRWQQDPRSRDVGPSSVHFLLHDRGAPFEPPDFEPLRPPSAAALCHAPPFPIASVGDTFPFQFVLDVPAAGASRTAFRLQVLSISLWSRSFALHRPSSS